MDDPDRSDTANWIATIAGLLAAFATSYGVWVSAQNNHTATELKYERLAERVDGDERRLADYIQAAERSDHSAKADLDRQFEALDRRHDVLSAQENGLATELEKLREDLIAITVGETQGAKEQFAELSTRYADLLMRIEHIEQRMGVDSDGIPLKTK